MKVKDYNEWLQFGFPKGYFIDGTQEWYELPCCDYTGKILLDDEVELDDYISWIEEEEGGSLIYVDVAVQSYLSLKTNHIFKVGDPVVIKKVEPQTSYRRGETYYFKGRLISRVENHLINTAFKYEKELDENKFFWRDGEKYKTIEYITYGLTGYRVKPIRGKKSKKAIGYELDYSEQLVHYTPEIEENIRKATASYKATKKLFTLATMFRTNAYSVANTSIILEAIKKLELALTETEKEYFDHLLTLEEF